MSHFELGMSQFELGLRRLLRLFWQKYGFFGQKLPLCGQNNEKTSKINIMKRNFFFPAIQGAQIAWLANFGDKLPALAAEIGVSTAQSAAAVADCGWLIYILQSWLPAGRNWTLAATIAANDAQNGDGLSLMVLPVFAAPALP